MIWSNATKHCNTRCVTVRGNVTIKLMDVKKELQEYIHNNLGINVNLAQWDVNRELPLYLSGQYEFFVATLFNTECLFAVLDGTENPTPGTLRKHFNWLISRYRYKPVFVTDSINSYDRKRMIQNRIAFIIPGKQMYLPPLGIDFRDYVQSPKPVVQDGFSPSAQSFFLLSVYFNLDNISSKNFSASTPYSKMTVSRAFKELKEKQILQSRKEGRIEVLSFTRSKKDIWTNSIQDFHSPVTKKIWVKSQKLQGDFLDSGLTALSEYTMLSPPSYRTVAISRRKWSVQKDQNDLEIIPGEEPDATLIEIWSYEPKMLSKNHLVDPLSLYLIFKDNHDERIQSACSRLLERVVW